MKRLLIISGIFALILGFSSCEPRIVDPGFEDMEDMSIYTFLVENDSLYGRFLKILEAGGVDKVLSAYNPYSQGYTLFLPDSQAIDKFIASNENFATFEDLLADKEYVTALSKYHIVNLGIDANDFPFGALPAFTLSEDYLTVNIVEGADSAYYVINNQAPVSIRNIEVSNGFIHVLTEMLAPITYTTYDWLEKESGFSIFKAAVDATGFDTFLDFNLKDEEVERNAVTLLLEHDSIYHKAGINSLQDLIDSLKVTETNYTNEYNRLHQYVGYHILDAYQFLFDFQDQATNYTTFSSVPININGNAVDLAINKGKDTLEVIVEGLDSTFVDYIGFNYDASNVLTQSGAIHVIDHMLRQVQPSRAIVTFEFWEEPLITEFRQEPGEYFIEDSTALYNISWTGPQLMFVESADEDINAWGDDWLQIDGDFSIKYRLPKIVQGNYNFFVRAHAFSNLNALIEVYIDGKKLGGLIDFAEGGSADNPFQTKEIGSINFSTYESHVVELRSLIPGKLEWDHVRFEPVID